MLDGQAARLVEEFAHLVRATLVRVVPRVPPRIDPEDLVAEGNLGLCRAATHFDPERGTAFRTFAISHIRGAMLDYLRNEDWVPRSVRRKERRGELVDVIALVSLSETVAAEVHGDELPLAERVADPAPGPEELTVESEARDWLWRHVERLSARDRRVLELRYRHGMTQRQAAGLLGLSEGRISQIQQRALNRMREEMAMVMERDRPGWTEAEDARLLSLWGQHTKLELGQILGRSTASLYARRKALLEARASANGHVPVAEPEEMPMLPEPALPEPGPPSLDPEIAAMATVLGALEPFAGRVRQRVVRWVMDRLAEE